MQDELNSNDQQSNVNSDGNLTPPTYSDTNANNANQAPLPTGMRTVEPINADVVPAPTTPVYAAQNQLDPNTPIQKTMQPATEPNPLSQGSGLIVPKKGKKKLIILLSLIFVVLLLGGGSVAAYFWYQSPQKVINDSLIHAVTSKASIYSGNVIIDSNGTKVTVDIKSKQVNSVTGSMDATIKISYDGEDYETSGSVVYDSKGDLYFKISNLEEIASQYLTTVGLTGTDSASTAITNSVDDLVERIDDTWVKVSSSDLKEFSQSYATSKTCIDTAVDKFKDDKKAIAEVTDLYTKNQFVVVDKSLGQKDGSFGYQVKGDEDKAESFVKGFVGTTIYKTLHDCDETFAVDADDVNFEAATSTSNVTTELWVDVWSHKPTKLVVSGKEDGTSVLATIKTDYNSKVEVTTPTDSISLSQLKTYIEEFTDSITSAYSSDF